MATTAKVEFGASRYTTGAIVLHWAIALLIFGQLLSGYAMVNVLKNGSTVQFDVYQLHKSLGVSVLILTLARILWRLFNPPPPEPKSVTALEGAVSHAVHMAFYGLLLLIPLTGWVMITVAPIQVETILFFAHWLPWPHLPWLDGLSKHVQHELAHWSEVAHLWLAYAMGGLLVLHIAGALKHHLADGVFVRRMMLSRRLAMPSKARGQFVTVMVTVGVASAIIGSSAFVRFGGEAELAALEPTAAQPPAAGPTAQPTAESAAASADESQESAGGAGAAQQWVVDHDASALTYDLTYNGGGVSGGFESFDAQIRFSPDNLAGSAIHVSIDTTSAFADSSEISRGNLTGSDGFDNRNFGTATFVADTIRAAGTGYVAEGFLTIRGQEHPQTLGFEVDIDGERAIATGSLTLDRLAYGVGADSDSSGDTMSLEVTVNVAIAATKGAVGISPAASSDSATIAGAGETDQTAAQTDTVAAASPASSLEPWTVIAADSKLAYSFAYQGEEVTGELPDFSAEIRFDAAALDGSSITATVDLDSLSVATGGLSVSQIKGTDGLNVRRHGDAQFTSERIDRGEDGGFVAHGTLTARGVAQSVSLPFALQEENGRTLATGSLKLINKDYGFGEDADVGDDLGPDVSVTLSIVAQPPEVNGTPAN